MRLPLAILVPLLAVIMHAETPSSPDRVETLLARLTLDEKLGQLTQGVIHTPEHVEAALADVRAGRYGSFILSAPPEIATALRNQVQNAAVGQSRLGIPLLFGADTIHGYRTTFPIPLALAAAWDTDLVERTQAVAARETRAVGAEWIFAPMCDLARDPRWGRVAETFGEDPYLGARLVAASVRGFQGSNPAAPDRAAATLKHFVGYSATTGGRDYNTTDITPFTLRNAHLPAFESGIQAGALGVMSAFNAIDGIPAVANGALLNGVLRDEWKFTGLVVSDWNSVAESIEWGYAANRAEAARRALLAGNDMDMISGCYRETLASQVANGSVPLAVVDEAVRRVLRLKLRVGLFETPFADPTAPARAFMQADAVTLAREAAARSLVLLKNDGVLPLAVSPATQGAEATPAARVRRIALVGPLADDATEMLGTWPGHGRSEDVVTLATGLRERLGTTATLTVNRGCDLLPSGPRTRALPDGSVVIDEAANHTAAVADETDFTAAVAAAREADVIIAAVGEPRGWSGENASRAELTLTGRQSELLRALAATGKPLVVVVFSGRPLALTETAEKANALVQAWHPGLQAGPALAAMLCGDLAPVGRLPMSFPRATGQVPVYYNYATTGRPDMVDYRDLTRDPLYRFGYGLTYTTFSYGSVEIVPPTIDGQSARARATVKNTGSRTGEAVAQLYVRDVACSEGARPAQELRGWQRLTLAPGESRTVEFTLTDEALGFIDRAGLHRVESGEYRVWIAPHAGTGEAAVYQRP
ncbi:MAG: glycoside hydrolase family 3 C-terminal domain-containing protein [Opitutus sp.]|nr:glycoside hydrolase family 3 C-terminal domain-containing protein [Opitutus sp.]MCS6248486.1 glycoside hydrolase family 3 C-terminal domain-containing protein [Opitutus sp.]MCS6273560.1 glycoside hydrolase family 3 C-terminal domain-containing protein [Opitutus sp.]MCS6278574.1 glycoside hydrolase family 3 C-terminal domain-containing protein [Opitutus sp.]MCS6300024.1 glycoside hydrolase family 3 C-terminal domain-containing protein [Opitutus sp.]